MQIVNGVNMLMFTAAPILVAMAAFGTYAALGGQLTADVAFPALAYFDLLRFPLIMLPWQIIEFVSARVALKRLQKFVNADETDAMTAWEARVRAEGPPLLLRFCSLCSP
jgi:ATP-binding cassette, subfamily C (CFTR/MRP), member 1